VKDVQFILTDLWLKYYDNNRHRINDGYSAALQGVILFFPKTESPFKSQIFNNSITQFLILLRGSFVRLCLNFTDYGLRQLVQQHLFIKSYRPNSLKQRCKNTGHPVVRATTLTQWRLILLLLLLLESQSFVLHSSRSCDLFLQFLIPMFFRSSSNDPKHF
jgi:hypothetical protein